MEQKKKATYKCIDRGSDRCPCFLAASGQCYTCSMLTQGHCGCGADWQGICPYTEFIIGEMKPRKALGERKFKVVEEQSFGSELTVAVLETPAGFGMKCSPLGTFLMVRAGEWQVPLSVMKHEQVGAKSRLFIAVGSGGPKVRELLKHTAEEKLWRLKGPYFGGVTNSERFDPAALSIVVARGIAVMPVINCMKAVGDNLWSFYLDRGRLPHDFIDLYLEEIDYKEIDMIRQEEFEPLTSEIASDYRKCLESSGREPNVFVMTSPYYSEKISETLWGIGVPAERIIFPNHANMCCGMGMCGACSYTDERGITVRRCKCTEYGV